MCVYCIYLAIYLSIYLSIYPSIYPSIHLSIHLSIYLSIHLSIYPSIHLSISLLGTAWLAGHAFGACDALVAMATLKAESRRESGLPGGWAGLCFLLSCLLLTSKLRAVLDPPGPNSKSVTPRSCFEHLFSSDGKGQGWTGAMPRPRGDMLDQSHKAPPEIHGIGPSGSHGINRICKRSFKRAQQRLALHGFAYYHGRLLTGLPSNRHEQPTTNWMTSDRAGKTRKRLAICCWNAMALSSSNFVELLQWASVRQIDPEHPLVH